MNLLNIFKIKKFDEVEALKIIKIMDTNRKVILERAFEILRYCNTFPDFKPFIKGYVFSSMLKNRGNYDNFDIQHTNKSGEDLISVFSWNSDEHETNYEYELFALIPIKILCSNNYKALCKVEHLILKNQEEVKKLERERLSKIKKEKEEFENFLELKKKYGAIEEDAKKNK